MPIIYLALFVLLLAFPVSAQTLAIRSGEHENFSRLVLTLPIGVEWSLTQQGRTAALTLDLPQVHFGIADVFKRIPRSRLARVTQSSAGAPLEMFLACDCKLKSFTLSDRRLVIDIMDPRTPSAQAPDIHQPILEPTFRFPMTAAGGRAVSAAPFMLNSRNRNRIPRPKSSQPDSRLQSGSNADTPPLPPKTDLPRAASRRSEKRLLAQIDRAVDQGLLDFTGSSRDAPEPEALVPDLKPPRETPSKPGLSAQTSVDRDLADVRNTMEIAGYGSNCYPAEMLKLAEWGSEDPFADQIGTWRSELYHEFDILNRDAQIGLAKNYIYFGFGAEAAQVLKLKSHRQENTEILLEMSRILDGLDAVSTESFLLHQGCSGASSLWAVLAASSLPPETNDDAVLQALMELPAHLRHLIGLRISRIYMSAGRAEIANTALRIAERASASRDPAVDLAAAEINALKGDRQTASEQAARVVTSGAEQAAEALVKLVKMRWETGGELPPETAELAEAFAMENRGSSLGDQLQEARVLALAMRNQFRAGFEALAAYEQHVRRPASPEIWGALFTAMTDRADDLVFLELVLGNTPLFAKGEFDHVTEKVAGRLMELGFHGQVQKLLGNDYGGRIDDDGLLIRAEAALAADLPHRAMAVLGKSVGSKADRLRAQALSKSKNHAEAAAFFTQANDAASAARSYWLAGELENIPDEAPLYGATAQSIPALDAGNNAELPPTPLAQARALLEGSEHSRGQISDLLDAMFVGENFDETAAN
ncbi:hypothetical protein [Pontibaca salina]|uniref:Uncharacterized protein n=1 Tax=Pontibaca salina TaxID=2795731 RepID=A0A934HL77_9RHOB|nr:hypothetical protein [Pontibaca salina]MBI6628921.1 hypothetical protein [Pontibaca salina]